MIVPMIKYQFLLYHKDLEPFLEEVRAREVLDITRMDHEPSEAEKGLWQQVNAIGKLVDFIDGLAQEKVLQEASGAASETASEQLVPEMARLQQAYEQVLSGREQLAKQLSDSEIWGEFSHSDIETLAQNGCALHLFSIAEKQYAPAWQQALPLQEVARRDGNVYFAVIRQEHADETAEAAWQQLSGLADEQRLPALTYNECLAEMKRLDSERAGLVRDISDMAARRSELIAQKDELLSRIDFGSAAKSIAKEAEDKLVVLQGYVPSEQDAEFRAFLETQPAVYIATPAERHEDAPILLKNNWFAKFFEPIGALNSMPLYGEIDMTPFVAPFFWLFYGFCLGDGGYGLLFIIAAAIAKRRMKPSMKPILTLVQFFGASTLLFGILTGSFFGIALGDLAVFAGVKDKFLDSDFLFALSLIVGMVQILFGMCIKMVNITKQQGFRYAISTICWFFVIVSSIACWMLSTYGHLDAFRLGGTVHLCCLCAAAVGIFLFNSPGKNPLVNIGCGVWDTYNMVTGMVGDLLSYIRLFVLGLSGSILGAVFNTLAFGLAPDIPVLGFIISLCILLFGHFINIFMNGLGAFVHTIRLTFLEFYKASGYTGGGTVYNPFRTIHTEQ